MSKLLTTFARLLILSVIFFLPNFAVAQSGGNFAITQSVIASGGQTSTSGNFAVQGAIGESLAGTNQTGGTFFVGSGFWADQPAGPTAAHATVSGRVRNKNGIIRRVYLVLTDVSTGLTRSTQSNPFGYYRFANLEIGHFYIIQARSKNFTFTPDTYAFELVEDRENVDFTGERIVRQ